MVVAATDRGHKGVRTAVLPAETVASTSRTVEHEPDGGAAAESPLSLPAGVLWAEGATNRPPRSRGRCAKPPSTRSVVVYIVAVAKSKKRALSAKSRLPREWGSAHRAHAPAPVDPAFRGPGRVSVRRPARTAQLQ